ncbi:MAG: formyltransferase family protein [archaeon]|nr:formyltransferase family protein [archaeon]
MVLEELHNPSFVMKVAGLMSGSGTNLRKIIEYERVLEEEGGSPYKVAVIFSDNSKSKAVEIGRDFDIPVITRDIESFYLARGKPRKDMDVRQQFDDQTIKALEPYALDALAYAGYMSIASHVLIDNFKLGINVHPADLSVRDSEGRRKYTGDAAVRKAILAGEKSIRATTHIVESKVDYGRILMVSNPLNLELGDNFDPNNKDLVARVANENQNRLKEAGDWIIFPLTLKYIAEGRYTKDAEGNLYCEETPIPDGERIK